MKLGKLAPAFHPKTLSFAKYLVTPHINGLGIAKRWNAPGLSPASKVYREYKTPIEAMQMYGNDRYGCCVWAMVADFLILTTVHTGNVVIPTLADVLGAYSAVTGFDPTTGANDNGTSMTAAFAYLQSTGIAGHKILAWAQIDHTNLIHRRLGVDLFGATCTGVQLPDTAQTQFAAGQSWEVSNGQIEGGHAILHPGYGSLGDDYVTWAKWDQKASAAWSSQYVDEEYVLITEDWFNQVTKLTPGGLDLKTLEADLNLIAS
jgi:hypothetical protein